MDIYETCPVLENDRFRIRLIQPEDSRDLFKVYSDKNALPFFNSDNCHGDNFYMKKPEHVDGAVQAWLEAYRNRELVRMSVADRESGEVIGTVELFKRLADDFYTDCALLRLDLRSDYERKEIIQNLLSLITAPVMEWLECSMAATKARNYAVERILALNEAGYQLCSEPLIGHDGTSYDSYYICMK